MAVSYTHLDVYKRQDQINNGQISVNHASKVYGISRSTITYWNQKLRSFEQKSKTMSKNEEIKKLRKRIEELEFVKDLQQDICLLYTSRCV